MEGFRCFTPAVDRASDFATRWVSADDGVEFTYPEMMLLAAHLDINYPLEERCWYIVFPDGEIDLISEDFDEIFPMYLPLNTDRIVTKMTGDEFYPDAAYQKGQEEDTMYCPHCGKKIPADAVYCSHCGKKVW